MSTAFAIATTLLAAAFVAYVLKVVLKTIADYNSNAPDEDEDTVNPGDYYDNY